MKDTVRAAATQNGAKKRLILLDIDDTLFFGDTFLGFLKFYLLKNPARTVHLPELAAAAAAFTFGLVDNVFVKLTALKIIRGEKIKALDALAKAYIKKIWVSKRNRKVGDNISRLLKTGLYDVIVISASPSFYIKYAGEAIGAKITLATDIRVGKEGSITDEIDGKNCKGAEKIERLKRVVNLDDYDLEKSYAFSDSITDAPIFELVGRPVAVTPDSELYNRARRENWQVIIP